MQGNVLTTRSPALI